MKEILGFFLFFLASSLLFLKYAKNNKFFYKTVFITIICLFMTAFSFIYWHKQDIGEVRDSSFHESPDFQKKKDSPDDQYPSPGQEGKHPPKNEGTPPAKPGDEQDYQDEKHAPPAVPAPIIVPDGGTVEYTVAKGDTLYSISRRSGFTVTDLKLWNGLTTNAIYTGQTIKLHGKNAAAPSSPVPPPTQEASSGSASSRSISQGSTKIKEIAFTFDAGSDIAGIDIINVLNKHKVKATFFLTGKWVEKYPSYAKQIAAEGHEIGNHGYNHLDALKVDMETFKQDLLQAEAAILKATGRLPRPYFRFPYGSFNEAALKAAGQAGYPYSIYWSLDTVDWKQPSTELLITRIEKGASNGDIVLMHIGGIHTPEAVDQMIPKLKAKGYRLVTLTELMN
ncbi:polysaccharide deacetylase family protein [Mesobacillus foraminis]|uniref:polysaccharide deacetylase family protein n=1 Tax=Mesobacillus foraminis TaxID=279826 RepID=UPI0013CE4287|nr:polysaccharide deacetylase family protein [Mesobacillus foraminis]